MNETLQLLRVQIDRIAQLTLWLKPISEDKPNADGWNFINSHEIKCCSERLYLAKAWTGMLMGTLGSESPYKNDGKRKEVADIEATDAKSKVSPIIDTTTLLGQKSHIEIVDYLRQEIKAVIAIVEAITTTNGREAAICRTNMYTHLCEARFALGFELERIKNEAK